MAYVIRIVGLAVNFPHPFDGKYVKKYDPSYVNPEVGYDGGILEVTDDISQALRFDTAEAAFQKYRETAPPPHHLRWYDGQPNRPLSAWTVAVEPV